MTTIRSWSRCDKCDKFKAVDKVLKEGDKVDFPVTSSNGRTTRVSIRTGKISHFGLDTTAVIYRKKLYRVDNSNLSDPDGASALSVALMGECDCKGGE